MAARTAEITATTVAAGALLTAVAAAAANDAPPAISVTEMDSSHDITAVASADVQPEQPATLEPAPDVQLLGTPANENEPEERASIDQAPDGDDEAAKITTPVDHYAGSLHDTAATTSDDSAGNITQGAMPDFASHGGGGALMDALLTLAATKAPAAEDAPAHAATGMPAVQEFVAEAAAENFMNQLLDHLTQSADNQSQSTGDHSHDSLLAALGGQVSGNGEMAGGLDAGQMIDHAIDYANVVAAAAAT